MKNSIKVLLERYHTAMYDIVLLIVFQLVRNDVASNVFY